MDDRAARGQGKEVEATRPDQPCPAPARPKINSDHSGSAGTGPEREILLERIDPSAIGSAELDALEQFFDDIISRALAR